MKILTFGDIYGRVGRNAFLKEISALKNKYMPDFIIANVDNISSGRGPKEVHIKELLSVGVDVMCSGDHFFDNEKYIEAYMRTKDCRLIRPANFYEKEGYTIMGKGYTIIEKNNKKLAVIHLIGQVFMRFETYNPFWKLDEILLELKQEGVQSIVVDFHRETTSEIAGLTRFFDGQVSFIYGTHTHIQTNDEEILARGTGYITDLGMTGPKNSIIGADIKMIQGRFFTGVFAGKVEQSLDPEYTICGAYVEIDEKTGKCTQVEKIRLLGKL